MNRATATARRSEEKKPPAPGSLDVARAAHLRYVDDHAAGIQRRRKGAGFDYVTSSGRRVTDKPTLQRIRSLAIPPAWKDVWICSAANGHIQAIGRDARGRKQYRYHPRWREFRDREKYDHMISFAKALPRIRRRARRDLKRKGLPREKVLAVVVRLLEKTLIRVGNEEYAKQNESFGLTTMQDKHVDVSRSTIHFEFRGKAGVEHAIDIEDRRLAKIVKNCQELPGYDLFQYLDEQGGRHDVKSEDINDYLREIAGEDFTAKDFRTWAGTVLAAMALREFEAFDSETQAKKNVVRAIESVAKRLGNTKAVCRKCYIHPEVLHAYLDGSLVKLLDRKLEAGLTASLSSLSGEEAAVMALLHKRLGQRGKGKRQKKG